MGRPALDRTPATRIVTRVLLAFALVGSVVAGPAAGSASADPGRDLRARAAKLRSELRAIEKQMRTALTAYEAARDAETEAVALGFEAAELADRAAAAHSGATEAAASRIRSLYMAGGQLAVMVTVMEAPTLHDAMSRYHNVAAVIAADHRQIDALTSSALAAEQAREKQRAAAHRSIQAAGRARKAALVVEKLMAKQAALLADTDAKLRAYVEAEARKARELAARALAAASAIGPAYQAPNGRYACPVGPTHSFVDTWGAPRSGGRRHQGTDVFAPYGSPAYAVVDGVVDKWGNGGLGGITLWIRADNGDRFYYAHNSVNIAPVGSRVRAGQIVARVGTTGNAATTPPHIHFEAHPGGGAARNPYPFLRAVCGG